MKKVFFEIGGKKLMMKVDAKTDSEAKEILLSKVIFHKIENIPTKPFNPFNDENINNLKDILGIKWFKNNNK